MVPVLTMPFANPELDVKQPTRLKTVLRVNELNVLVEQGFVGLIRGIRFDGISGSNTNG
jgi:hypothetical protein